MPTVTGIWYHWNNATNATTTASTTLTTDNVWRAWATTYTVTYNIPAPTPAKPPTPEQQAARDRRTAERERIAVETAEAATRARELLQLILSDEQWQAYEDHREFYVIAKSGRRYLVRHGMHGNVKLVDEHRVLESLCIQPPTREIDENGVGRPVPTEDILVAQVLGIRHDEEAFRKTANITPVHAPT